MRHPRTARTATRLAAATGRLKRRPDPSIPKILVCHASRRFFAGAVGTRMHPVVACSMPRWSIAL